MVWGFNIFCFHLVDITKLLDIHCNDYLTRFELSYFFRAIQDMLRALNHDPVNFDDVCDEIFDMVSPSNPDRITLNDLLRSRQGKFHYWWIFTSCLGANGETYWISWVLERARIASDEPVVPLRHIANQALSLCTKSFPRYVLCTEIIRMSVATA